MNKTLSILKIVLLSIISISLIIILILLLNKDIKFTGITLYEKTEAVYEKTFNDDFSDIKVDIVNNDVKIEESENNEVNIKVYDRKDAKPKAYIKDDTLYIANKKEIKIGFFTGINGGSRIVITVPKNKVYNLNVTGISSDVESLIDLKKVKISTKSGDISLKEVDDVNIKTISGDIDIEKINEIINSKTTSGDITISEANGELRMKGTSGDVTINKINLLSDSYIRVVSGDITIGKSNEVYFDTKAVVSGNVRIKKNYRKADIELKMKTTSGDITINN